MLKIFGHLNRVIKSQQFVLLAIALILAAPTLVSAQQTGRHTAISSKQSPKLAVTKTQPKILQKTTQPIARAAVKQPPEPLISVWKGPVQPIALTPGVAPVFDSIPTTQPVVFLGIDDGWFQTPDALNWLTDHKLPFTMFLENDAVKNNYDYFRQLQSAGLTVEDHTLTHPDLTKLSLDQQKAEICGAADTYSTVFGQRPTLFRPPYGAVNASVQQAAADCGMKAIIMWHADVNGGVVLFQDGNQQLLPGDIVLMHFRPEFLQDMQAFTAEVQKDHLQVGRLEDWLQ